MAILTKGVDFTTGDQVTAVNLDNLADAATFAAGAVDNATTQLSGGAIIVKDGGITSAKLDTNIAVAGTLSAVGILSTTSTNGQPIRATGATTGESNLILTNTGGSAIFGQENSAGGNVIVGSTAYDTIVRGTSGIAFSANGGTGMQMRLASTGLAVTGTLTSSGAIIMSTTATPTGTGAGVVGQMAWDTNYFYICTATNDWRRIALVDF